MEELKDRIERWARRIEDWYADTANAVEFHTRFDIGSLDDGGAFSSVLREMWDYANPTSTSEDQENKGMSRSIQDALSAWRLWRDRAQVLVVEADALVAEFDALPRSDPGAFSADELESADFRRLSDVANEAAELYVRLADE